MWKKVSLSQFVTHAKKDMIENYQKVISTKSFQLYPAFVLYSITLILLAKFAQIIL